MTRIRSHFNPTLLLLFALSLFALTPLFSPGYFFNAHDGRHSVFYQIMFDASLRDGALWPRWAMHHAQGYGYPTFVLQAPVGFYLGELFVLLGAGFTTAVKFVWAIGFLVGGWGMFELVGWWGGEEIGRWGDEEKGKRDGDTTNHALRTIDLAALLAALLYVYLPYRLVDAYVRGALNDTLLLAWFPWVFLAFDRLIVLGTAAGWQRRLAWAILALGGTLLTHTFALLSFTPLLITFVLFRLFISPRHGFDLRRIGLAAAGGIGGGLLSMAFLLPLLAEGPVLAQQVYVSDTYDFRNHFVFWGQFLSPFWGFGYSDDASGANDGMSFQLGALIVVLVVIVLWVGLGKRGDKVTRWQGDPHSTHHAPRTTHHALLIYLTCALLALLFVMTPLSRPLWEAIPPLAVIQFPWRLLALAGFVGCGLIGVGMGGWGDGEKGGWGDSINLPISQSLLAPSFVLFCLLAIFASATYADPPLQAVEPWREDGRSVAEFEGQHPDMMPYTKWSIGSRFATSPMTADYASPDYHEDHGFTTSLTRLTVVRGGRVKSVYSGGSSGGGVVQMDAAGVVQINIQNFPGWQVSIDGQPVEHRVSVPVGLLEVDVPAGEHRIDARMGSTPDRVAGAAISWGVVVVVLGLLIWGRKSTSRL